MRLTTAMKIWAEADYNIKRKPTLNMYCNDGIIPAVKKGELWNVNDDYVYDVLEWCKETIPLNNLIETDEFFDLTLDSQKNCRRRIRENMADYIETDGYSIIFADNLIHLSNIDIVKKAIREELLTYKQRETLVPIRQAAEEMGISVFQAKENVKSGTLPAIRIKKDLYVTQEAISEYKDNSNRLIGIYDYVKEIVQNNQTVFDPENARDRAALFVHIRKSEYCSMLLTWEQAGLRTDRRNAYYFPAIIEDRVNKDLTQYLKQFGLSERKLQMLAKNEFWKSHPRTYEALIEFSKTKTVVGMAALFEALIETIDSEIMDCTNTEINRLKEYVLDAPTKIYLVYAAQFITFIHNNYKCAFNTYLTIDYQSKKKNIYSTNAYSLQEYMGGAYMAFSDEYIADHNLIKKALKSEKYAHLWLHMIWQYVGAWRNSDFYRLKVIPLLDNDEVVREKILLNQYKEDADTISLLLENEINNTNIKPHKTKDVQNSEVLVVVFPELLRDIIGLVYSICVLHSDKVAFKPQQFEVKDYISFFGPEYEQIFGRNVFLNRRANKAFLDLVRDISEKETGNRAMGHIVASYARAHATEQGKLSTTTFKYLQAKMDGYSINEILMMLWDTGACSFIPYMLLEVIYGDRFAELTFAEQSELIKISSLTALQAENTSVLMRKIYIHSQNVLDRLFYGYNENRSKIVIAENMVQNIINRKAIGKQLGVICLCAARRIPCAHLNKTECFGCEFAVYERGLFFLAIERLREIYTRLDEAKTDGEKKKIQKMLDDIYLPSVYQMLVIAKHQYGMNIDSYKDDIKNLINGGGRNVIHNH